MLRRAGYVESVRGAHGGYRINKDMREINALEIVELLEGSLAPVACIDDADDCERTGRCSTEGLWRKVDTAVREVLSRNLTGRFSGGAGVFTTRAAAERIFVCNSVNKDS